MREPDWFILIKQWVANPRRTGLTLPFLVGALARKAGRTGADEQYVREVLNEIVARPVGGYVAQVSWCGDIRAPVLSTARVGSRHKMASPTGLPNGPAAGNTLAFTRNIVDHWSLKDPRDLLEKLTEDAVRAIRDGGYSRRPADDSGEFEYADFTTAELEFIDGAIGIGGTPDH
jgi:hypothetical protein